VTTQSADGQTVTTEEFDYVGETTPLVVAAYPGVAFYPRYIPECFCIWPVAYYGGVWINYLGAPIVYRGGWSHPPVHIRNNYVREFHTNPHPAFHRAPPGHFSNRPGGPVTRPAGPQQHVPQQQHVVPQQQHQQQVHPGQPQMHVPQHVPQARPPQMQQRQPQVQQRAPQARPQQRAPAARGGQQKKQ
jgi:hypothetical protein